jgi:hypothetical protein
MRYSFQTRSGSRYLIDTDELTWKRANTKLGHEEIIGLDKNEGTLVEAPYIHVGLNGFLRYGNGYDDYIVTTPVERVELLSE